MLRDFNNADRPVQVTFKYTSNHFLIILVPKQSKEFIGLTVMWGYFLFF